LSVFYFFSALNLITACFVIWFDFNKKVNIFSPIMVFSLGHIISYFFCVMIYQYSFSVYEGYKGVIWLFNRVAPLSWLFYMMVVNSYFFFRRFESEDKIIKKLNTNSFTKKYFFVGLLLLLLGLICLFCYYKLSGGFLAGISDYSLRVKANQGLGLFNLLAQISFNWSAGIFAFLLREEKKYKILLVNLGYLFVGFIYFVIYGGRTTSFFPVIIFVSISLLCRSYTIKKTTVPIFVFVCFIFCLQTIRQGGSTEGLLKNFSDKVLLGIRGSYGDFGGLLMALAKFPEEYEFLYYSQFKDVVIYWIPRYFYPGKPIQFGTSGYLSRTMMNESTYSYVLMNIGELYVKLGILGVVLGGVLIGYFVFFVSGFIKSAIKRKCPYKLILSIFALFSILGSATRASFESLLIGLTPNILVFFLLNYFTYKRRIL
jgi:oligosaccharide repeat unit polymerase